MCTVLLTLAHSSVHNLALFYSVYMNKSSFTGSFTVLHTTLREEWYERSGPLIDGDIFGSEKILQFF
jgi:hypothetical protein